MSLFAVKYTLEVASWLLCMLLLIFTSLWVLVSKNEVKLKRKNSLLTMWETRTTIFYTHVRCSVNIKWQTSIDRQQFPVAHSPKWVSMLLGRVEIHFLILWISDQAIQVQVLASLFVFLFLSKTVYSHKTVTTYSKTLYILLMIITFLSSPHLSGPNIMV